MADPTTQPAVTAGADDPPPKKARDKVRPFLKLKPKPADEDISGDGIARGCFFPAGFGDVDKEIVDLLKSNVGVLGLLHDALQAAHDAVEASKTALRAAAIAVGLAVAAGLLAVPLAALAEIGGVIAIVEAVLSTIDSVLDTLEKKIIGKIAKRLIPRACRVMPHWVPVKEAAAKANKKVIGADEIFEVQGIVTRSYQSPIDVPFFQWHRWFNWTVEVKPDAGFEKILSKVPNPPTTAKADAGQVPIQADGTIECQWDCGALFQDQSPYVNGQGSAGNRDFEHANLLKTSSPMSQADWAWPMPGQFFWAAGRWAYDCSRATTDDASGKHAAVLNPCKAVATARLEGFQFPENELPVPATQFMFFSSKRGGYLDHDTITDQNYEFIVDLPELADEALFPFTIGRTEAFNDPDDDQLKDDHDFLHNTLVIRPRLLVHANTGAFGIAGGKGVNPVVELLKPEKGNIPIQAKVTIPMTSIGDATSYGVILSLGWFDPEGAQAGKVRECIFKPVRIAAPQNRIKRDQPDEFTRLVKEAEDEIADEVNKRVHAAVEKALGKVVSSVLSVVTDAVVNFFIKQIFGTFLEAFTGFIEKLLSNKEEWLVHVGVNGRWKVFQFKFPDKTIPDADRPGFSLDARDLDGEIRFLLLDGERVHVSMSGMDFDPIGEVMIQSQSERALAVDGQKAPDWPGIVDPDPADATKRLDARKALIKKYVFRLLGTLGDDNDPTGFIENNHATLPTQLSNNLRASTFFTKALDDQRTLVLDSQTSQTDHALFYSIEVKKPQVPGPAA